MTGQDIEQLTTTEIVEIMNRQEGMTVDLNLWNTLTSELNKRADISSQQCRWICDRMVLDSLMLRGVRQP